MAQLGFHGIIGVGLARPAARALGGGPEGRQGFGFGFVLGNILPDADFFLLGPLYLISSRLGLAMHRTWSHSLITIVILTLCLWLLGRNEEKRRRLALGLGCGMVLHSLVDVLVWFSAVDLAWPLGWMGLVGRVDLWHAVDTPRILSNLLGAADYLAFALFFIYLGSLARRQGTDLGFLGRLGFWTKAGWGLFVVYTVLALILRANGGLFDIIHYAVFILVFLPVTLHIVLRMRRTIERAAVPETGPAVAPGIGSPSSH